MAAVCGRYRVDPRFGGIPQRECPCCGQWHDEEFGVRVSVVAGFRRVPDSRDPRPVGPAGWRIGTLPDPGFRTVATRETWVVCPACGLSEEAFNARRYVALRVVRGAAQPVAVARPRLVKR